MTGRHGQIIFDNAIGGGTMCNSEFRPMDEVSDCY